MKCPGCGSALFDGQKCEACGRLAADMTPPTDSKLTKNAEQAIIWVAMVILWAVLLLHFFADRIWDQKPAFLTWFVVGWGCLVLLRLIYLLVAGKKDERIGALVMLAIIVVVVVIGLVWSPADPTDPSLSELTGKIDRAAEMLQRAEGQPLLARMTIVNESAAEINGINLQLASMSAPDKLTKLRGHQFEKVSSLQKRMGELLVKQRELLEQILEESKRLKKTNKQG